MDQQVKEIDINDLVLWTENPRDSIDNGAKDQDVVDRALEDKNSKWNLNKMAKEMGSYYDFSELPTVVYHEGKPVVYDGNRRIILGKIKHGLVRVDDNKDLKLPIFPKKIPCNVCKQKVALQNVYRKHADTGSWQPLERDIFLHKHMGEEKSTFVILDEETGLITANQHLNKRFVKEEVFKDDLLKKMGFSIRNGSLHSVHEKEQSLAILSDLGDKINRKEISTRKNRGKVIESLEPSSQKIIDENRDKPYKVQKLNFNKNESRTTKHKKKTRRQQQQTHAFFGGHLYLRKGDVSDLYRDVEDLHTFYSNEKKRLSGSFQSLIRMSLRLLCETAAKDMNLSLDKYLEKHFDLAKSNLSQDSKTTLSTQNVRKGSIVQLLHVGAHNYSSSNNIQQTMAISIIIGAMLTETHGMDNS